MVNNPDLNKRDYEAVARVQERLLQNHHPGTGYGGKSVKAYEDLANTNCKAGKPHKAASSLEKAIALARKENAKREEIEKLQKQLGEYKSA